MRGREGRVPQCSRGGAHPPGYKRGRITLMFRSSGHGQGDNSSYVSSAQIHSAEQESRETYRSSEVFALQTRRWRPRTAVLRLAGRLFGMGLHQTSSTTEAEVELAFRRSRLSFLPSLLISCLIIRRIRLPRLGSLPAAEVNV